MNNSDVFNAFNFAKSRSNGGGHRNSLPHLSIQSQFNPFIVNIDSSEESKIPPNSIHLPPVPSTFLMPQNESSSDDDVSDDSDGDDSDGDSDDQYFKKRRGSILEVILKRQTKIKKKISSCSDSFSKQSCVPNMSGNADNIGFDPSIGGVTGGNIPISPAIIIPERPSSPQKRKEFTLRSTDSLRIFIYAILVPFAAILSSLIIAAFIIRIDSCGKSLSVAQFDYANLSIMNVVSNPYGILALSGDESDTVASPKTTLPSFPSALKWTGRKFSYSSDKDDWKRIPYNYNKVNFKVELREKYYLDSESIASNFISKYPYMDNYNSYTDYIVYPGFDRDDQQTRRLRGDEYRHFKQHQQYMFWIRNSDKQPPPFVNNK